MRGLKSAVFWIRKALNFVAPFMGAWIEILYLNHIKLTKSQSHPLWVRGLKSNFYIYLLRLSLVAPFMGAWIEIKVFTKYLLAVIVAPFMGAWIEISVKIFNVGLVLCQDLVQVKMRRLSSL